MDEEHTFPPHQRKRVSTTKSDELRTVNDKKQSDTTPEPNPTQAQEGTSNSATPSGEKPASNSTKRTCLNKEENNAPATTGQAPSTTGQALSTNVQELPPVVAGSSSLPKDTIIGQPHTNGTLLALARKSGNFISCFLFSSLSGGAVNQCSAQGASSSSQEPLLHPIDGSTLGSSGSLSTTPHSHAHREISDFSGPITKGVFERINTNQSRPFPQVQAVALQPQRSKIVNDVGACELLDFPQ